MNKSITLMLIIVMILSLGACKGADESSGNVGVLADMAAALSEDGKKHMSEEHGYEFENPDSQIIKYDSLSSLLLALRADDVSYIGVNTETADFILAESDDLTAFDVTNGTQQTTFSMMTMDDSKDVYNILNNAILELKADGTLDKITKEHLTADKEQLPKPAEIPVIEGADTIVVAVTGDMPPLDYISSDGKPAGFNVALLSAIAKEAGVNIELTHVESGARMTALSSGKVDAIFWSCATICSEHQQVLAQEAFENTLITEPYAALDGMMITMKQ